MSSRSVHVVVSVRVSFPSKDILVSALPLRGIWVTPPLLAAVTGAAVDGDVQVSLSQTLRSRLRGMCPPWDCWIVWYSVLCVP